MHKFEQVVFDAVKDKVREGILELIEKERKGEGVDRELLKSVVNVSRHSAFPYSISHAAVPANPGIGCLSACLLPVYTMFNDMKIFACTEIIARNFCIPAMRFRGEVQKSTIHHVEILESAYLHKWSCVRCSWKLGIGGRFSQPGSAKSSGILERLALISTTKSLRTISFQLQANFTLGKALSGSERTAARNT